MQITPIYVDTDDAAAMSGMSVDWLEKLRLSGNGPPYIKPSRKKVLYKVAELVDWLDSHRRTSTTDGPRGRRPTSPTAA